MFIRNLKLLRRQCKIVISFNRQMQNFQSPHEFFTKYLELPLKTVDNYIQKNRLNYATVENLQKVAIFCDSLGFSKDDLLENPMLLRTNHITLEQHYVVMIEGGFHNITPPILAKFRTLINREIIYLKSQDLIPSNTDVAKSLISHLNPCPADFNVENPLGDLEVFDNLHLKIFINYIKWRLNATDEEIIILIRTHLGVRKKSFRYLSENIAIAEDLGFTPEKMLKYGYVLQGYPKYTQTILEKYPLLAGYPMKRAMRMYPKLVSTSPERIEKIHQILKEHNIPDETIQKRMNIFHLSPETVRSRLEELKRISDFKVLWHHPGILKLVVHMNRAKSRLSFMKQLHLKCSGVTVLGYDKPKFHLHVREGRDIHSVTDTVNFIKGIFRHSSEDFVDTLKKHPFFLQVPFLSMEETYNFLIERFSSSAIFEVIYILLYPREKIRSALEEAELFEKGRATVISEVTKLHLVLYFIEKEHHFTGNGIWDRNDLKEEETREN